MNILSTTTPQILIATPKDLLFEKLTVTNETTNESIDVEWSAILDHDYYIAITVALDLTENTFYTFNLGDSYTGRFFCTNQEPSKFSVNKDRYVKHASTNNYIVL